MIGKSKTGRDVTADVKTSSAVSDFISKTQEIAPPATAGSTGRLIFALDATMSRQPTWDMACQLQGDMFNTVHEIGSLEVQLVYFRGYGECRASKWTRNANEMIRLMTKIRCQAGRTQIGKVLARARQESAKKPVSALVYVGDALEENIDLLADKAGELGLTKVPAFMFQEGHDSAAEAGFREIARLSGGAYARFSAASADELRELLKAVASYATGGKKALKLSSKRQAALLLEQLR